MVARSCRLDATPAGGQPGSVDRPAVAPAPLGRRIGARVVDVVVAGWVLAFVAIEMDGRLLGGDVWARRPIAAVTPEGTRLAVIAGLVLIVLEVLPTALWGRSPGKALLGVRCVGIDTGRAPGLLRAVLRALLVYGWAAIPVVGWLLPVSITLTTFLAAGSRGVHDRLAGTVVVDAAPQPGNDLAPDDPRLDPL